MPKTHLKKFYKEQETLTSFPTTPEPEMIKVEDEGKAWFNPLNQFAEITLQKSHQEMLLAQYLHRLQGLDLTPSNSPSPPPAHISPSVHRMTKPPAAASNLASAVSTAVTALAHHNFGFLPPPQTAPEDLRVVARKIDFPTAVAVHQAMLPLQSAAAVQADSTNSAGELLNLELEDSDDQDSREKDSNGSGGHHECPDCGKAYSTSSNLARHRQTHRSLEDKKARKCPHCEKTYVSMPAYSMHIRTHNQGCKCPFCGKCFSRPWLLQGHIRTHTGEKPFRCHICEKAFADKSNLRAHIQTHSNTKPFVCVRCNKAFALKSYLYKHEESSCMKMVKNPVKERRKSSTSLSNISSTPSPPLPISQEHLPTSNDTAFGHNLLLALSKARVKAFQDNLSQ